jgi:hypothetical protein
MKAKVTDIIKLVSKHFYLVTKGSRINYNKGEFEAYEMIAKGSAMIDIINRTDLNKNQKKEIVEIIKTL